MQEAVENALRLKRYCSQILENPKECGKQIKALQSLLPSVPTRLIQRDLSTILCIAYPIFKNLSEDKNCYKDKDKEALVDVFRITFDNATTEKTSIFFNFTGFLLSEIYNPVTHKVLPVSEEYKLIVIQCTVSLAKSLSWDVITELYVKENTPKLCQAIYVALEIAKNERLRSLRLAAIELLMCLAQVHDGADVNDLEIRCNVADIFMFFLPGIASGLRTIALEDEKSGHKTTVMALRAWGRIIALQMEDFSPSDNRIDIFSYDVNEAMQSLNLTTKWKSASEVKAYINNSSRTIKWYKQTDENLHTIMKTFMKLIQHSHTKVRVELAEMCNLLIVKCNNTVPKCVSQAVHILIACSEDRDNEVKSLSEKMLEELSEQFSSDFNAPLIQNLEENFYNIISTLPRIFNRQDRDEQLTQLKLLTGYINLFGTYKLSSLLLSPTYVDHLLKTLLHISELEKSYVHLLEEIANPDLETYHDSTQWKKFHYFFNNNEIRLKLEEICTLFCKFEVADVVSDFLLDVFLNNPEQKCEATFLLNSMFTGNNINDNDKHIIKNIIATYLESENWNVMVTTTDDALLLSTRKNILQACLQTEGIGIFAAALQKEFEVFLLKCLYLILERAGSSHPLIRQAGLATVKNIIKACGYKNVTEFININSDYFAYHVTQKLNKLEYSRDVLNVLGVVMDYSTIEVLLSLSNIIEVVLAQSCDKFQHKYVTSYLRVFNIFIKCLHKWFDIKVIEGPVKSKLQKQKEFEEFKISGISEVNDFSDDIMGQTAEEMYKEDMKRDEQELEEWQNEEEEGYIKPLAPNHVNMAVSVLKRALHFLPSKDKRCKLLALEILRNGLEVIKDWEDELLPIVHQIWSPLVDRFTESEEPLIVNLSFQLLVVMARVSKDFIRARTVKDVLPKLLKTTKELAKESYLKDKGSSYRYTQAYKLQVTVLQQISRLVINLDTADNHIEMVMDVIQLYLSNKQPLPLQEAARSCFKEFAIYDADLATKYLQVLSEKSDDTERKTNIDLLLQLFKKEGE